MLPPVGGGAQSVEMLRNITTFHTLASAAVERTASGTADGQKITYNVIKARLGELLYKITSQKFEDPADGEEHIRRAAPLSCYYQKRACRCGVTWGGPSNMRACVELTVAMAAIDGPSFCFYASTLLAAAYRAPAWRTGAAGVHAGAFSEEACPARALVTRTCFTRRSKLRSLNEEIHERFRSLEEEYR